MQVTQSGVLDCVRDAIGLNGCGPARVVDGFFTFGLFGSFRSGREHEKVRQQKIYPVFVQVLVGQVLPLASQYGLQGLIGVVFTKEGS
jgi:hypothetical protein